MAFLALTLAIERKQTLISTVLQQITTYFITPESTDRSLFP
jgi:hypothetical protein